MSQLEPTDLFADLPQRDLNLGPRVLGQIGILLIEECLQPALFIAARSGKFISPDRIATQYVANAVVGLNLRC